MSKIVDKNLKGLCHQSVAEYLARALCEGARAGQSRRQLSVRLTAKLKKVRARCQRCQAEWPVLLLGRDAIQKICVIARRSSFLVVRRRIEEQVRTIRMTCPSCSTKQEDGDAGPEGADRIEDVRHDLL